LLRGAPFGLKAEVLNQQGRLINQVKTLINSNGKSIKFSKRAHRKSGIRAERVARAFDQNWQFNLLNLLSFYL
jgi:hypothetical protein